MTNYKNTHSELKKTSFKKTNPFELSWGYFLATFCMFNQYETIVEIGVQHGRTAVELCYAAKMLNGKYFGYDFFAPIGAYGANMGVNQRNVEILLSNNFDKNIFKLTKVDTFSDEFSDILKKDTGGIIDFAFIDGCHSYKGITNDFLKVYPLLSEYGSIVFHDTYSHIGPRKFVLDLYTKYNDGTFDVINLPSGITRGNRMGLTILTKRSFHLYKTGVNCNNTHEKENPIDLDKFYKEESNWFNSQKK